LLNIKKVAASQPWQYVRFLLWWFCFSALLRYRVDLLSRFIPHMYFVKEYECMICLWTLLAGIVWSQDRYRNTPSFPGKARPLLRMFSFCFNISGKTFLVNAVCFCTCGVFFAACCERWKQEAHARHRYALFCFFSFPALIHTAMDSIRCTWNVWLPLSISISVTFLSPLIFRLWRVMQAEMQSSLKA
jgi:hypothetical protein